MNPIEQGGREPTIDELRQRAAETRLRLAEDVNALTYKLSPGNLKEEAKEALRERANRATADVRRSATRAGQSTREFGEQFVVTARHNPVPTVMIGAGVGWLLYSLVDRRLNSKPRPQRLERRRQDRRRQDRRRLDEPRSPSQWMDPRRGESQWTEPGRGQRGESRLGEPRLGESRLDEPQLDEPQWGESRLDEPQWGEPQWGESQWDEPQWDEPQWDEPQLDEPQLDEPQRTEPQWSESRDEAELDRGRALNPRSRGLGRQRTGWRRPQVDTERWTNAYERNPMLIGAAVLGAGLAVAWLLPPTRREDEWVSQSKHRLAGTKDKLVEATKKQARGAVEQVQRTAQASSRSNAPASKPVSKPVSEREPRSGSLVSFPPT